jgi:hypothetical protein
MRHDVAGFYFNFVIITVITILSKDVYKVEFRLAKGRQLSGQSVYTLECIHYCSTNVLSRTDHTHITPAWQITGKTGIKRKAHNNNNKNSGQSEIEILRCICNTQFCNFSADTEPVFPLPVASNGFTTRSQRILASCLSSSILRNLFVEEK